MKKSTKGFYLIGFLNLLHGLSHIILPLQSFYLAVANIHSESSHSLIEEIIHHPIMGVFWAFIGILGIYFGIKDHQPSNKKGNE